MNETTQPPPHTRREQFIAIPQANLTKLSRYWFWFIWAGLGYFIGLPFLAPVFMRLGWSVPAKVIYTVYAIFCHQLPQRSFFLFGTKIMYSLDEIQAAWQVTNNPLILRQFIGNQFMGWKVAWSDRMVFLYTSVFVFALLWWLLRKKTTHLPLWGFFLMCVPLLLDGSSHFISDLEGIDQGFRISNQWLVSLTGNNLPPSFYSGNEWLSFNSIARLASSMLFSFGVVWFGFPYLEELLASMNFPINRS